MRLKLIYSILCILVSLLTKSQICSGTLGAPVFNEDFGAGSALYGPALPTSVTGYTHLNGVPINGSYAISNTGDPSGVGYVPDNDHTGNPNGYMMVVNADYGSTEVYRKQITGLCPNTTYVFSAYLANNNTPASVIANCGASYIFPNVKFRVEFPASVIQASVNTGNLPLAATGSTLNWQQYGFVFNTVAGQTSADIIMSNNASGGCGNDYVVDDITFSPCGPGINISVSPSNTLVCSGQSLTLLSNYTSGSYTAPQYQWQYSSNGGVTWTNIVGANSPNYPIASASSTNAGMYQLLASENGNILNSSCRIIAGPVSFSVASLTVNSPSICTGQSATLIASSATSYIWSTGSTANSTVVTPTSTTNYTINANFGTCAIQTITTVYVSTQPTLSVNSATICAGSSFVISPLGATNYTFSGGSATVTPISTSSYTVYGSNGASCSSSITCNVSIMPIPMLTLNSGTICSGNSFTLNPLGASSYTYSSLTAIINPSITSTFTVTGVNSFGCTNTATATVYVVQIPTLTVNSGSICLGESFTITPSGMNAYFLSSSSNIVAPVSNASYTVIGTNSVGCISTQTVISTVIVNPLPIVSVNNGTVCQGSSYTISPIGASSYTFSSITPIVSPISTTNYTIIGVNSNGCIGSASCSLMVIPSPSFTLSASSNTICLGSTVTITAIGATSYTWSNGSYSNSITVAPTSATIYTVIGTNSSSSILNCNGVQTIGINVLPKSVVSIIGIDSICKGASTNLFAAGASSYTWSPNTNISNIYLNNVIVNPSTTTVYSITSNNVGYCNGFSTYTVNVKPTPIIYAGRDTLINIDESVVLHGTGDVLVGFLSENGDPLICNFCPDVEVSPKKTTCYMLKGENSFNCIAYDEVCVTVKKDWEVYIPNAFTPNEDGDNEYFLPIGYGIVDIKLTIFDRWGNQIFKSTDAQKGWNGKFGGKICEQGIYVYIAEITTMAGLLKNKVGHVSLLGKLK